MISHKVLSLGSNDTINDELVETLTDAYKKALVDFAFAPVSHLPEQRFTNLGVFAEKDIEMGSKIELMGFLAEIPKICDMLVDAKVSVFKRKRRINARAIVFCEPLVLA